MWKYLLNNETVCRLRVVNRSLKVKNFLTRPASRISHFESVDSYGFTLLEVLVATMVISLAMAGLMSIFLVAAQQGGTTVNKGGAAFYQTRILEELRQFIVEDPASYTPAEEIEHSCTSIPVLANPHYILEDSNSTTSGGTTHEAIRTDAAITAGYEESMLPSTDDLVSKYNATVSYTVEDQDSGGNGRVSKKITVDIDYEVPDL